MLKSILIGVDGSSFGTAAIDLGVEWARRFDAALVGLGIVDEPEIRGPEAVPLGGMAYKQHRDESLLFEAHLNIGRALENFRSRSEAAGVSCKSLKATGFPAEQLMLEAQRYDLVLLGQRTSFPFETQGGSDDTLRNVVKHSPRPVVAVPEKPRQGSTVVIAYDGSLQAARTLQAFQGLGLNRFQSVHVVSVHPDPAEAARWRDRAVDYLRFHDIAAQSHTIATSEEPAHAILKCLDAMDGSLLVMGAYGQATLKEMFFGSVTQAILEKSPVPVFLFH